MDPVGAIAGYFPELPPTPKPLGGPIPDRVILTPNHHVARMNGHDRRKSPPTLVLVS